MDEHELRWAGLLRAERQGDAAAYASLLAEITRALRGLLQARLYHRGFDASEAEDIVQEVLLAVHGKRHTWDAERAFVPWLASIAHYKFVDAARRMGRARLRHVDISRAEFVDVLAAPPSDHDIRHDVELEIAVLPLHQRDVVQSLSVDGHSVRDTARRLGRSEAAIRVTFNRALQRLAHRSRSE